MTELAGQSLREGTEFVGRQRELATLSAGLEQARSGRGGLFLIGGEPGIGKSRLADELSNHARAEGAIVLSGRCWEGGGAPAYWPWVQCLRSYLRTHDEAAVRRHVGRGAGDIAQILPELEAVIPDPPAPAVLDPESARFRLFDATATFLRNAAAAEVHVIVIDDLQAADTPSLMLLRFLATQLAEAKVLILATYRDVELTPDHPLTAAIAEMAREPTTHHLQLRGLEMDGVALLAHGKSGSIPPQGLVAELHRQTNGNPLFVGEALKLLASEGGFSDPTGVPLLRFAIPGAVRDVITRRLGHLSARCRSTLTLASVLGPEVPMEGLRRVAEVSAGELLEVLDEAVTAGLLVDVRGARGRYRFSHDLVREVVYDEISGARRARLHLQAGQAIEALFASDLDPHLGEVAHHYFEAAPAADPAKVTDYARRAAAYAARQLAYEEAVRLYQMALQAMELNDSADETARCELLLELGDAQMRAGETPRAKETFLGAAAIARRLGIPEQLARAALGYGGRFVWARAANDRRVVPLLEDALTALGDRHTLLRARVLARLAGALRDQPRPDRRDALSRQAVEIARGLGDAATLAYALDGRYSAIWAPDTVEERLRIADEIIKIAETTGDAERVFQGHHYRSAVFLELGDIASVKAELDGNARLADELRQPAHRWYVQATIATLSLLEGRFDEAESLIAEAFDHGRHAETLHARGVVLLQRYALRSEQGRASELEDALRGTVDEYAFWPWMRCALLHMYVQLDRRADARSLLEAIAGQDFRDLPWDNDWLMGMSLLAEVVAHLRDTRRAGLLYELLSPYGHLNGYGHPEFCTGSISRPLGILSAQLGRWDDSERHFEQALEMNERMGALPWLAHTRRDYAVMLVSRDAPGDRERADQLLRDAQSVAQQLGMVALDRKISELLPAAPVPVGSSASPATTDPATTTDRTTTDPATIAPATSGTFTREGEYWTITFENHSFRLRDSKGLQHLARLLAQPGREILALDLVQQDSGARVAGSAAADADADADLRASNPAEPDIQLDAQAKSAYRERLRDLREDLSQAEEWNDPERADRARAEIDFLARELARAVGLGGRDRSGASATERARVSVTRAIRAAMVRIAQHSAELGEHLETTIHTGTYCAYRPDPRVAIAWETRPTVR
jgi:tetratricopeptide (TPR) repeat protein